MPCVLSAVSYTHLVPDRAARRKERPEAARAADASAALAGADVYKRQVVIWAMVIAAEGPLTQLKLLKYYL